MLGLLARLVPKTTYGVPNNSRNVIAAQIAALAHRLNRHQVHDGYMAMDTAPDDKFLALLHAGDWAHGRLAPDDDQAPSMEWLDVVKRRKRSRPRPP